MHQATQSSRQVYRTRHAAVAARFRLRSAFTMVEILIVIGIIVLLLGLSVPAFSWLTGSNSTAGAENNISAMIGRARGDALGLQRDTGVFFFVDPASQRVAMAEVYSLGPLTVGAGASAVTYENLLELVEDRDFVYLPSGTTCQVVDDHDDVANNALDDRYIGFNTTVSQGSSVLPFGGVIMFDANGRLVSRSYGFARYQKGTSTPSNINNLLNDVARGGAASSQDILPDTTLTTPSGNRAPLRSSFGIAVMEREPFLSISNGNLTDAQIGGTADVANEENWINENSVPLLINRFNGTLLRSE